MSVILKLIILTHGGGAILWGGTADTTGEDVGDVDVRGLNN